MIDLKKYAERIEKFLDKTLLNSADVLHQAMRYSVLAPGKRLRPLLVYAAGQVSGAELSKLDYCAASVELIHAYSLIHDDLPCMDDDDFRRGLPSCHKKFDETTAVLAGDALQSLAFNILTQNNSAELIKILSQAIGPEGMVLGQSLDMVYKNKSISEETQKIIHHNKTAKLIMASVQLGGLCGNLSSENYRNLILFSENFGLAFQYQDDTDDNEGDVAKNKKLAEDLFKKSESYLFSLPNTDLFFLILNAIKANNNIPAKPNH